MSLEDEDRRRDAAVLQSRPSLVVGTRAALSLCDDINVGMIGWIDADGEARSHEYDARTRAFGLMWESLWRGLRSWERTVLLQTRRPGRDWQMGLDDVDAGWRLFWRRELREREEFTMPPYAALVKVEASLQDSIAMAELLDGGGFEFWVPEDSAAGRGAIWLRTKRMSALRRIIEPFFHIKRARRGYPSITVWHE
jgi:primosomal protein N' (replication factor Y)